MAEFKKIEGDIKLVTEDGTSVAVHAEGVRVPEGAKAIGEYFGAQVAKALAGITEQGVDAIKGQVGKLEQSLANKDAEIDRLENEIKTLKKASSAKRNTPAG